MSESSLERKISDLSGNNNLNDKTDSVSNLSEVSLERKISDLSGNNSLDNIYDFNRSFTSLLSMKDHSSDEESDSDSSNEEQPDQVLDQEVLDNSGSNCELKNDESPKKISLRERMSKKKTPTEEFNMINSTPVAPQRIMWNQMQNNMVHMANQMMINQCIQPTQSVDEFACQNLKSGRNSEKSTSDSETVKSSDLKRSLESIEVKPKKKVSFLLESDIEKSTTEQKEKSIKIKSERGISTILKKPKFKYDQESKIISLKTISCNDKKHESKSATEITGYIDPSVLEYNAKHKIDVNSHIIKKSKQEKPYKVKTPVLYTNKVSKSKNDEIIRSEFLEEQQFDQAKFDITINNLKKFFNSGFDIVATAEDLKVFLKKKYFKTIKAANNSFIYFDINEEQNCLNGVVIATKTYAVCFNLTQGLRKSFEFLDFIKKYIKNSEVTKITYNVERNMMLLNKLFSRDKPVVAVNLVDVVSTKTDDENTPCFFNENAQLSKTSLLTIQQLTINYFGYSSSLKFVKNDWENSLDKSRIHLIAQALKFTQSIIEIYKFQCKKRNQLLSQEFRLVKTTKLSEIATLSEKKFLSDNSLNKEKINKLKLDIKKKAHTVNYKNLLQEATKLDRTILTADKYFALKYRDNKVILVAP